MRNHRAALVFFLFAAFIISTSGCKSVPAASAPRAQQAQPNADRPVEIGGEAPVTISRKPTSGGNKPEFTSVTMLPGRGMNVFQIMAALPGKGEIPILNSPSIEEAATRLTGTGRDRLGGASTSLGGAFLIPYPNRVLGALSPDGQSIVTSWRGHKLVLPGGGRGAPRPFAIHGLILKSKAENLHTLTTPDGQTETAEIDAGDFGGHWLSSTELNFRIALTAEAVDVTVTAKNVGKEAEPMAIGWHPYFRIPSGDRAQARIHVPGAMVAVANQAIPTGQLIPVKGTEYDYLAADGAPLDDHALDTNFSHFQRTHGMIDVRLIDPEYNYGLHVEGLSPQIQTVQIYSPQGRNFVAVEDQFNYVDPFGSEWKGIDTGMVALAPGQSVSWRVRLALFTPGAK